MKRRRVRRVNGYELPAGTALARFGIEKTQNVQIGGKFEVYVRSDQERHGCRQARLGGLNPTRYMQLPSGLRMVCAARRTG
jgi:hypothetical protein